MRTNRRRRPGKLVCLEAGLLISMRYHHQPAISTQIAMQHICPTLHCTRSGPQASKGSKDPARSGPRVTMLKSAQKGLSTSQGTWSRSTSVYSLPELLELARLEAEKRCPPHLPSQFPCLPVRAPSGQPHHSLVYCPLGITAQEQ